MSVRFIGAADSHELLPTDRRQVLILFSETANRKHMKVLLKHYAVNLEEVQQLNDHTDRVKAADTNRLQWLMYEEQRFLLLQVKEL